MARFNLEETLAKKATSQPQFDYLWRVELPNVYLNKQLPRSASGVTAQRLHSDASFAFDQETLFDLNSRVTNITTPHITFDTDQVSEGNTYWYKLGKNNVDSITLEIHDNEDNETLRYLEQWRSLVRNNDGTYNPPAFYKRDLTFWRLSCTRVDLQKIIYKDVSISGINEIQNSYDSNGVVTYSVNLTCDDVQYKYFQSLNEIDSVNQEILSQDFSKQGIEYDALSRDQLESVFDRVIASGLV